MLVERRRVPEAEFLVHSPFRGESRSTKVPDFSKYTGGSFDSNLLFQYFMVGTMGAITAAGAKSTVHGASC